METTLQHLIERSDAEVLDHLDRQVTIPVLTGPQAQGDLLVVPCAAVDAFKFVDVEPKGIVVLAGQHDHRLLADGDVGFAPSVEGQRLGWLRVGRKAVAWLLHQEHGGSGIGEGTYELRRQREQAQEQRLVAD